MRTILCVLHTQWLTQMGSLGPGNSFILHFPGDDWHKWGLKVVRMKMNNVSGVLGSWEVSKCQLYAIWLVPSHEGFMGKAWYITPQPWLFIAWAFQWVIHGLHYIFPHESHLNRIYGNFVPQKFYFNQVLALFYSK